MKRKLYRSVSDRKIAGICGGLSEYFDIDSSLIRLAWIIFSCCAGAGVLAYIIAALVIPTREFRQ